MPRRFRKTWRKKSAIRRTYTRKSKYLRMKKLRLKKLARRMKPRISLTGVATRLNSRPELKFKDTTQDPADPGTSIWATGQTPNWTAFFRLEGDYSDDSGNTCPPQMVVGTGQDQYIGTSVNFLWADVRFVVTFENRATTLANSQPSNIFRLIVIKQKNRDINFNNDTTVMAHLPETIYEPVDYKKFKVIMERTFATQTGAFRANVDGTTGGYNTFPTKPRAFRFIVPIRRTMRMETNEDFPVWPLNYGIFMTKDNIYSGIFKYINTRWYWRDP